MLRCTRLARALNKSIGHRWSSIPKPPPRGSERLYGTHSVLNALRVFAGGIDGAAEAAWPAPPCSGAEKAGAEGEDSALGQRADVLDAPSRGSSGLNAVLDAAGATARAAAATIVVPPRSTAASTASALAGLSDGCPPRAVSVKNEATDTTSLPLSSSSSSSSWVPDGRACHPHRAGVRCLYVRDFSVEGVAEAAEHSDGSPARRKMIPRHYSALHRITALAKAADVPVRFVPRRELWQLCGDRRNQNVVLEVAPYAPTRVHDAGPILSAFFNHCDAADERGSRATGDARDGASSPVHMVALYLDRVVDPVNIGSIIRTSFFFDVDFVALSADSAACTPAVARTSTGFLEHIHVLRSAAPTEEFLTNTRERFEAMRAARARRASASATPDVSMETIATTAHALSMPTHPKTAAQSTCGAARPHKLSLLLLGNEDAGLPAAVVAQCSRSMHVHCPRQDRLRRAAPPRDTAPSDGSGSLAAPRTVAPRPTTMELRARAAEKLRRLPPQEVSLNVNCACATLLAKLAAESSEDS